MARRLLHLVVLVTIFLAVQSKLKPKDLLKTVTVDWSGGDSTSTYFSPVFADYNAATAEDGLTAIVQELLPLGSNVSSASVRGYHFLVSNRADDVYFGLKGLVTGLPRNARLQLSFDVTFASSVGTGCFGIGGSPGDNVWLKVGASRSEPYSLYVPGSGVWRLASADKGEQSGSGPAGSVVSSVALAEADGQCGGAEAPFFLKTVANHVHRDTSEPGSTPYIVRSAPDGSLWLLVGFESGFEGLSHLAITRLVARIYRV